MTNPGFNISTDTMVVTTSEITNDRMPILLVSHQQDEDGDLWQFHSGTGNYSREKLQLVRLDTILRLDPNITIVGDLPLGYRARRNSPADQWVYNAQQ